MKQMPVNALWLFRNVQKHARVFGWGGSYMSNLGGPVRKLSNTDRDMQTCVYYASRWWIKPRVYTQIWLNPMSRHQCIDNTLVARLWVQHRDCMLTEKFIFWVIHHAGFVLSVDTVIVFAILSTVCIYTSWKKWASTRTSIVHNSTVLV